MLKLLNSNFFKIFLLKLLIVFISIFLLDLIIGNLLRRLYFKQETGYDFLTTYSIEKTEADILVFGSSRAVNIFNTTIIEKKTGLSCYNVGRYGEPLFYHYGVLKSVLKRYTPKIIILSFDAGNFSLKQEDYDRLSVLFPYYDTHPEIRPIVELKGPFEKLKFLSNIYQFNSLLLPIIVGNISSNKKNYINSNGYISNKNTFTGSLQTVDYSKERKLDSVKINIYKSFIKDCISKNIQLYIVCPPYLINSIGKDSSIREAKKIATECHIDFFDYARDSFYTSKPQIFADYRHLNDKGVEIFSNSVIDKIYNKP